MGTAPIDPHTGMFSQLLAIARNGFIESVRQPVYFILIAVSGLAQVFNNLLSAYSMGYEDSSEVHGDDKLFLDMGLATVLLCATLLAAFIATAVISREIEQKTALTVISKPVGRPLFVIGKYIGVAGAMLIATCIMLFFFLLVLQHGVMSRAADEFDQPVIALGLGSILVSVGIAVWCNFFYGWVFSSTAVFCMLPLTGAALLATLMLGPHWQLQPITKEVKPMILMACGGVGMAMVVITAVAVACSTRLGQVMTILACLGVFMFGLLSNHFVGRRAFVNQAVESIASAQPVEDRQGDLRDPGDTWTITLRAEPRKDLTPGASVYFGGDPSGIDIAVPSHAAFKGDPKSLTDIGSPRSGPALIVKAMDGRKVLTIVNAGGLNVVRPPKEGDFIFLQPTRVHWGARALWSVAPNVQFFWLVDAVTQTHSIPGRYMALLAGYSLAQVVALLAVGVALFQTREVG